jgi:hypothetical protein
MHRLIATVPNCTNVYRLPLDIGIVEEGAAPMRVEESGHFTTTPNGP